MSTVNLKEIYKRYDKHEVVHGIDLEIHPGEFLVLVGPSGCGKSTVLRMIAGLEDISGGDIEIDGERVNDLPPKSRNIAMVFQNYALYPHMTVADNMSFSLRMKKTPKAEIGEKVDHAASILGLGELLKRKPSELSGGQRQRVAMGRAIVRNPKVFLFDEPLSNLDAKLRIQMRTEIKKLHYRLSNTIVYVTHDQVEAMTLADRIVVMKDGYVEQAGSPIEIFNHPANVFVAGFIGNPPMNLFRAKIVRSGDGLAVQAGELKLDVPAKDGMGVEEGMEVHVGIRPENVATVSNPDTVRECVVEGKVDVTELLGSETLLHLNVGGNLLVGKAEGGAQFKADETIKLYFNLDRLHIFNDSGKKSIY